MDLPSVVVGFFIVLGFSSFVKIATCLSVLRFGLGLRGVGFGLATAVLAFVLSLIVIEPHLADVGGAQAIFLRYQNINIGEWEQRFKPFLEKNTDIHVRERLERVIGLSHASEEGGGRTSGNSERGVSGTSAMAERQTANVAIASFLISQLHEAFRLGLLFIIPFVVVDLLVANIIVALGMKDFSFQVISLPLKLLLFFSVDGWALVSSKLLGGYF